MPHGAVAVCSRRSRALIESERLRGPPLATKRLKKDYETLIHLWIPAPHYEWHDAGRPGFVSLSSGSMNARIARKKLETREPTYLALLECRREALNMNHFSRRD